MASDFSRTDLRVFNQTLAVARRALGRLDDDHVPASLRDIAGRSGRLPPPLARRLLTVLDESDWLRSEALATWPESDRQLDSQSHQAALLFLSRPPQWEEDLRAIVEAHSQDRAESVSDRAASEVKRLQGKIDHLQGRIEAGALGQAEAVKAAGAKFEAEIDRYRTDRRKDRTTIRQLESVVADLESRLADSDADRARLSAELDSLRARWRRATSDRDLARRGPVAWELRDRIELARHLDDLSSVGSIQPTVKDAEPVPSEPIQLILPSGVRPDQAEALAWLLDLEMGVVVAIDGWNAAHLLSSPPSLRERERVLEAGRRLSARAKGRRRVVVVFDSREGEATLASPGVEVRFVGSADDEILDLAATRQSPVVVISSDRRVREGSVDLGAVGLWSEALVDWLGGA